MFCNDGNSKLVPESTQPGGFPSWTIFDNLHEKLKSEYLLLKRKVYINNVYVSIPFILHDEEASAYIRVYFTFVVITWAHSNTKH